MTRLGKSLEGKQVDLAQAFRFLGVAPSYRELRLVVNWLRESGIKEIDYDDDLVALAEANGSGWHEAARSLQRCCLRGRGPLRRPSEGPLDEAVGGLTDIAPAAVLADLKIASSGARPRGPTSTSPLT